MEIKTIVITLVSLAILVASITALGSKSSKTVLAGEEFMETLKVSNGVLIDVRTPAEFSEGHIEGAVNIDVEDPFFETNVKKLDPSQQYFIYCRSGSRSKMARSLMQKNGLSNVVELQGGVVANSDLLGTACDGAC